MPGPNLVCRVLAGLRAGCLPMQVEVGRYASPNVLFNERLCKLCGEDIEDQTHLLLQCRERCTIPRKLIILVTF